MKLALGLLLCSVNLSQVHLRKLDSDNDNIRDRRNSDSQARPECVVANFRAVPRIEAKMLAVGDWYEVFRTATSYPIFSSGVWRFQSTHDPDVLNFFFAAKFSSGKCSNSMSGEVSVSGTNPGTLIMSYDGLKGRVEEEYKVLQTDYKTKAVLYGCRHVLSSGECPSNATFLVILSKFRSLSISVSDNLREVAKEVCLEPSSLHLQDGTKSCNLDHLDPQQWKDSIKNVEWPVCLRPSVCTIGCPPCCTEGQDGCIHCNCGQDSHKGVSAKKPSKYGVEPISEQIDQDGQQMSEECVTTLSACHGDNCQLTSVRQDCLVCECPPILFAPPAPFGAAPAVLPDINFYNIDQVIDCPTTCRIGHHGPQMVCNCTNKVLCQPVPPGVPYSCTPSDAERYYFDYKTGTCHGFFGSCLQDINNNFHSLKECVATCADVCELPVDNGLCQGKDPVQTTRYYHNRATGECDTFKFGGCGGNDNNFQEERICKHKCPGNLAGHVHPTINDVCTAPSEKGQCKEKLLRYFYLEVTKTCTSFFYSGCGGNENNFKSAEECDKHCRGWHQGHGLTCPDVSDCSCAATLPEEGCPECKCDDDAANGLQVSLALLFFGCWISARKGFLSA